MSKFSKPFFDENYLLKTPFCFSGVLRGH